MDEFKEEFETMKKEVATLKTLLCAAEMHAYEKHWMDKKDTCTWCYKTKE